MSGATLAAAVIAILGCTSFNKTALSTPAAAKDGAVIMKTAMDDKNVKKTNGTRCPSSSGAYRPR
ncbi:MAG: hypothetical protein ACI81V_000781 [Lentimonas sp.]|jgi:hypothetical protein